VGGDRGLYDRLSAADNLRYFAELYGVDPAEQRKRINELLEVVGLSGREKERVEGYSRGMRQRLHIARRLLNQPKVLFLDEPSIGVDPVGARDLRRLIGALRDFGTTVLLTTHYMFEADELCDRIAIIASGSIQACGSPAELKSLVGQHEVIEIEAFGVDAEHLAALRGLNGVRDVTAEDRGQAQILTLHADAGTDPRKAALSILDGIRVVHTGRDTRRPDRVQGADARGRVGRARSTRACRSARWISPPCR
jgi:ABC-2 type transport system ATP-binding protein